MMCCHVHDKNGYNSRTMLNIDSEDYNAGSHYSARPATLNFNDENYEGL